MRPAKLAILLLSQKSSLLPPPSRLISPLWKRRGRCSPSPARAAGATSARGTPSSSSWAAFPAGTCSKAPPPRWRAPATSFWPKGGRCASSGCRTSPSWTRRTAFSSCAGARPTLSRGAWRRVFRDDGRTSALRGERAHGDRPRVSRAARRHRAHGLPRAGGGRGGLGRVSSRAGPSPDRRRPGRWQDDARLGARQGARRRRPSHTVHAGHAAVRHPRPHGLQRADAGVRVSPGSRVHAGAPGRRDQPRDAEDAGGASAGDERAGRLCTPRLVLATQNPVEYLGTYPLPESQLDRFLMRISLGYPAPEDERRLLLSGGADRVLD